MPKLIDLTGKKFGRLVVIKRSYPNDKRGNPRWLCKCSCGKETISAGYTLKCGDAKSCGCLRTIQARRMGKKNKLDSGLSSLRQAMSSYKRLAKRRGFVFELTEEQFFELTQKDCYYCGVKPNNIAKTLSRNGDYTYNGLDRIDNTKGYTMDNVVPCCKICNRAKHQQTLQEYKNLIKRSYNKLFKGESNQ